ncbi:MAC/perforin domain-containing protein [Metabacillus fastidiosus]|uniref:MAC/perforin domain-containing protein n=1 Tax=Metabacillus fastidiosus TaxID=1458 RepID=A0ABU6NSY9_9BACI|nr:MAC/perforin domain-containing protein [Metabacillus fastidiosus]MED4400260.1 MAC/perforin domain-containing protein [Metabacillus fastidiosus]
MKINSSIKLGTVTNLIYGYNPDWRIGDVQNDCLFRPSEMSLQEFDIELNSEESNWSYPDISLHDSSESLLSKLYPFRIVNPTDGTKAPVLPAGQLLISDHDRNLSLKKLSDSLGVDLSNPDYGYALVQINRQSGYAEHPSSEQGIRIHPNPSRIPENLGVNKNFRKAMVALRHCSDKAGQFNPNLINPKIAQSYLKFFNKFGTHFISKVSAGDIIFQVFAIPLNRFERIKKAYADGKNPLSGPEAISFRYFTTDINKGAFGYVKEYGKILSMSGHIKLEETMKTGDWNDDRWAKTNTIFAPFSEDSLIPIDRLNEEFNEIVPINYELTSMTLFAEHNRKQAWTRIFKAAITQKYKGEIKTEFISYNCCDVKSEFSKNQVAGFLSTISTPKINAYKPYIDLSQMKFIAKEEVKEFTLFSNVLHHSSDQFVQVPGTDVVIVSQLIDMENNESLLKLSFTDRAYDSFKLYCHTFRGALLITNEANTKHSTIVDGLVYTLSVAANGRYDINVETDIRITPSTDLLSRLKDSMVFSFAFTEGIISNINTSEKVRKFVQTALLWLGDLVPQNSENEELLTLRVQALDLAKLTSKNPSYTFVPLLPYSDYEKQVNAILDYVQAINDQIEANQEKIDLRKQNELIIDVAKTLNSNIVQSGELLMKIVDANAAQQKDLVSFYTSIINQKKDEYKSQQNKIDALEKSVNDQQSSVRTAIENYKQSVNDWETREWIKFGLDLATNLFDLGVTIYTPAKAISAVKDLAKSVQMIKKFLTILNATSKAYTSGKGNIDAIRNANLTLDGLDDFDIESNIAWDEMSQHFTMILATGPSDPTVNQYKAVLQEAFNIFVIRGKAWASAKSSARDLARDIYIQQKQQTLNEAQNKRLSNLKGYLKPKNISNLNRSEIDLIGLTGNLTFIQNQMMGILTKAFNLKDQALQYQFLQPPTSIESYDFLGFRSAITRQETNKIQAKTSLNRYQSMTTTPIPFEIHGVDINNLIDGNVLRVNIQPDHLEFLEYVNTRVIAVTAEIDGIKSTESGSYLINLAYNGSPFYDRDIDRNLRTFHTIKRERTYEYEVATNKPKFSDNGLSWSYDVNPITPFSTWEISLPKTKINKGMQIEQQTVNIKLTFILKARIKDIPAVYSDHLNSRMLLTTNLGDTPSVQDLVSTMNKQGSALNGWDVVFNLSLEKINDVLEDQYNEFKYNDKEFGGKISAVTKSVVIKGPPTIYSIKKFDIQYAYPRLTFLPNNDQTVNLEMEITSGTLTRCIQQDDQLPNCDAPISIEGEKLNAIVPITKMKGIVENDGDNIYSVILDLAQGSFTAENIEMSDEERLEFNEAVKAYFTSHSVRYIINSLDLTKFSTLEDLRPNQFLFKTLVTPSGNKMLQLFIQTANRAALDYSQTFLNNVPEPIAQGYECSLMTNSQLFFDKIIPHSMNKDGWRIQGNDPKDQSMAWDAHFNEGFVNGDVDLSRLNRSESHSPGNNATVIFKEISYVIKGGKNVPWPISGMTISPSSEGKLKLSFSKQQSQTFIERVRRKTCTYWCTDWSYSESESSTDFKMNISATLPLSVEGNGIDQQVKINVSNQSVTVDGRTSGGGPCGSDDLQAQVNKVLREQIPNQIVEQINVDFAPVSVFALQNLLFPNNNVINLSDVYAPGDLLILGNFEKDK